MFYLLQVFCRLLDATKASILARLTCRDLQVLRRLGYLRSRTRRQPLCQSGIVVAVVCEVVIRGLIVLGRQDVIPAILSDWLSFLAPSVLSPLIYVVLVYFISHLWMNDTAARLFIMIASVRRKRDAGAA